MNVYGHKDKSKDQKGEEKPGGGIDTHEHKVTTEFLWAGWYG